MVSVQLSVAKKTSITRNLPTSVTLDKPYDQLTVLDLKKAIAAKSSKVPRGWILYIFLFTIPHSFTLHVRNSRSQGRTRPFQTRLPCRALEYQTVGRWR